ncbi:hypothetical protein HOLleu_31821 [Holothuria leucospilota]|uniref:Ig-like domain-containing protein n=1 Tax=Holothuria leucospilota TaxID=206669 RepID=A0A9Q0YSL1_HOLLE|nr:hypothetical protein HOLleu_31821 [Holothuria leucospilota]
MASLGRLLVNFLLFLFTSLATGSSQYLLKPFPVRGPEGHSVTIYCQVNTSYTNRRVYWALPNNEGAIGPNINTNGNYERHQFVGNPLDGFYNLQISAVTEHDEGNYSCIFSNDGSSPGGTFTLEAVTFLDVTDGNTVSSTSLSCEDTDDPPVFEDNSPLIDFSCTAEGGIPLADGQELNWYMQLRNNSVIKVPSVTTVDPSGLGSVTATINGDEFPLTGHNDNSFLVCSVGPLTSNLQFCDTPSGATSVGNDDLRIRVLYKPLVQFLPSSIEVGMFEQFEVDLKCLADSNPPLMGYPTLEFGDISDVGMVETGNDSLVEGRLFSRVRLTVTRGDIGREINCTATNVKGTTTISIKIESLGGLPVWLICAIIFAGGLLAFFILVLCLCLICRCDLEQEGKRRERRRRTFRDSKVNGVHALENDDDFRDLDLRAYDNPHAMMPDSPHDSDDGSEGMVNDFKIEEPGETHHVQITSDQEFDDDDDEDPPKKQDYLHVTIADDTAGEEMELDELSRDRSPSLNEL